LQNPFFERIGKAEMTRLLVTLGLAALGLFAPVPAPATGDQGGIVDIPVIFDVVNRNRSELLCPSDGLPYQIRGRLEAPRSVLVGKGPQSVTLYLHSPVLAAQTEWRFDAVPGYDYAREQAKAGHATVTIDRLGYGDSGLPQGDAVCAGSQADVAHQVVQQLRQGNYGSPERPPVDFERVALAGFSGGGLMAEVEAYSFGGIDALIVIGWAETGHDPRFLAQAGEDAAPCATGGEHKYDDGTGPPGYAYIFKDETAFTRWFFTDIEPAVFAAARRAHERDPCGDLESGVPAIPVDSLHLSEITVPVLLVYGADDAVYPFPAPDLQRDRFTGSDDVTLLRPPGGHIVMLERTASVFRTGVSDWLRHRGF
jgi:pimeloyl-ACP methyl ester carboxylesterase